MIQVIKNANLRFDFKIKIQIKQIWTLKKRANQIKKIEKENNLVYNKILFTKLLKLK